MGQSLDSVNTVALDGKGLYRHNKPKRWISSQILGKICLWSTVGKHSYGELPKELTLAIMSLRKRVCTRCATL